MGLCTEMIQITPWYEPFPVYRASVSERLSEDRY